MNASGFVICEACEDDAAAISELIVRVARAQITHEFSREGRETMLSRLDTETIRGRMLTGYRYHLAKDGAKTLGVVGMRGYSHLYHLFVAREAQRRGIASALWEKASAASIREVEVTRFTVFSSRGAEGFYRRLGFRRTGDEVTKRGVVAIPMRLILHSQKPRLVEPGIEKSKENLMSDPRVETLSKLLADSYTLYLKTHNYHWNVTGPMFTTLHTMFETQYTELALAVDEIAERIRTIGAPAPASYTAFAKLAAVKEETGIPKATDMIANLVADQGTVGNTARAVIEAAESAGDQATADLATRRLDVHEKNAWMLRSHLE